MTEKVLIGIVAALTIALIAGFFIFPSCEEAGGHLVFSHYQNIFNGKTMTIIPIYNCEK